VTRIEVIGLTTLAEVHAGDNLGHALSDAWQREAGAALETDVLVVAQKVVSKAEGCGVRLSDVTPSTFAMSWGFAQGKDPRLIELVLRESRRIIRMDRGILIVETHHGFVCANAGVDTSNVPPGWALTLPRDPDASARALREGLAERLGAPVGVVIADTFGRPWRQGLTNVAIGLAGVRAMDDHRGTLDTFGRPLQVSIVATADEMASAAELVMRKTRGIPAVVLRGLDARAEAVDARALIRPADEDLFR
jgi:coenzyme F420-0:L-glutamate ligase/coenzyme F420-1:gamma-L-glutamate ligase